MDKTRKKSNIERTALEPQLAASMLYYDYNEFEIFLNLFREIESDPDLAPTGHFTVFIKHMLIIHKTAKKNNKELSPNEVIKEIEDLNLLEPNEDARIRFEMWFEEVKTKMESAVFELAEDVFYHYIWLYNRDKFNMVNKSNLSFEEKLQFKIVKSPSGLNGNKNKTFLRLDDEDETGENIINKRYTTGMDLLDNYLEPVDSNFMVIAARPSVGKSVTMLQMGLQNAMEGVPCLFISLEMTMPQLMSRIMNWYKEEYVPISRHSSIKKEANFHKLIKNFVVTANKTNNAETIFSIMEDAIEQFGTKIFFLDYLQLVRYTGANEWESLRMLTFALKQFAIKNNVLVVSCTQVSRESTNYGLELTSLFGSSTIENDTDIVLGLERVDRDNIDDSPEKELTIKILKNRQGISGNKLPFEINYSTMRFSAK